MDDTAAGVAVRIHRSLPVFDGHNDLAWAIRSRAGDLESVDPSRHLEGYHTDLPRMLAGGVGAQFWSVYVPTDSPAPLRETIEQIDLVRRMVARYPAHLEMAATADEVERIRAGGRIASLLGAEGGHSIEGSLGALRMLFELGVRYLTLTHGDNTPWADSATDRPAHGGLTAFGEDVVREMNRLGMLVDISHVAVTTMHDALRVSRAPIIASHSSAGALAPHPRNVPDDVLAEIGARGGVVMVTFVPYFIVEASARRSTPLIPVWRELATRFGPGETDERMAAERALLGPEPLARGDVSTVVDHIEHVARVAGVDGVGLGSDFDGVDLLPDGLEDVSCYPSITEELVRRSWSEADIRKVLGGNALRVLRSAEAVAG